MDMAYSDQELLPISHIRQFIFCPRIPWFKCIMAFDPPEQQWVKHGKDWHLHQNINHKRRVNRYLSGTVQHKLDVYVKSNQLGLHGYVDEVAYNDDECVLIEYKVDSKPPSIGHHMQLMAYVIAMQEQSLLVVKAAVLLKGSAFRQYSMDIGSHSKLKLLSFNQKLRQVLDSPYLPASSAQWQKCNQCEYLRYCNDR